MSTDVGTTPRKALTRTQVPPPVLQKGPDISGRRFGRLVAVGFAGYRTRGNARTALWQCVCDCGGEKAAPRPDLLDGKIISCGCAPGMRTHGLTKTPGFNSYASMVARCTNHNDKDFKRYGAKGIAVCERWLKGDGSKTGAECFFEDMGPRPSPRHSIDRRTGTKGYSAENCRWATPAEQARNTKRNYFANGEDPHEVCARHGVKYGTFRDRVSKGQSIQEALDGRDRRRRDH